MQAMNYIIKTPIEDCYKAVDILNILVNEGKIDVNKRHRILLPPLAYLMRENLSYLGGKYNSNYIPDTVIKLLLDNGANINTLDQNGDNLLKFAVITSNNNLYEYLTNKGININRINQAGQDPLYYVVSSQNTSALQNLINSGYQITPSKIISTGVDKLLNQVKNNLQFVDIFSKNCALNVVSLEDAIETLLGVEIVDEMDEVEDMQAFAKDKSKQFQDRLLLEKKRLQKIDLNKKSN